MGGAAAVLGAFKVAVKSKQYNNRPIHAVLCIGVDKLLSIKEISAENSVGSNSSRPDDIITMYSGKTVEINNTDAEGRLVLGDGVAYAVKNLNPKVIVDLATLTGKEWIQ